MCVVCVRVCMCIYCIEQTCMGLNSWDNNSNFIQLCTQDVQLNTNTAYYTVNLSISTWNTIQVGDNSSLNYCELSYDYCDGVRQSNSGHYPYRECNKVSTGVSENDVSNSLGTSWDISAAC